MQDKNKNKFLDKLASLKLQGGPTRLKPYAQLGGPTLKKKQKNF